MLTPRGRRTIAMALVAGVIGRILGIPELFGLSAAAVVVTLAALVRVRMATGTVTVTASALPPVVNAGEPATLELTIEVPETSRSLSTPVMLVTEQSQGLGSDQPEKIIVPRLR